MHVALRIDTLVVDEYEGMYDVPCYELSLFPYVEDLELRKKMAEQRFVKRGYGLFMEAIKPGEVEFSSMAYEFFAGLRYKSGPVSLTMWAEPNILSFCDRIAPLGECSFCGTPKEIREAVERWSKK